MKEPSKEDMELGEIHGFAQDDRNHPLCVHVMVRPDRYYNGPDGEHSRPNSTFHMARQQFEANKSIVVEVGSDEHKKILAKQKANRKAGSQVRA